jgi:hypothetical protein
VFCADWIKSHEHWTICVCHKVPHRHFHTSVEKMGWKDHICRDRKRILPVPFADLPRSQLTSRALPRKVTAHSPKRLLPKSWQEV